MDKKQYSVEAIQSGTVIDHIPAGQGLTILSQFKLLDYGNAVTVGFNLPSKSCGSKDIIKISGLHLDGQAANRLALYAPEATVNVIEGFKVVDKCYLSLPEVISGILCCPNHNCASHGEPVESRFYVQTKNSQIKFRCHYCEKTYLREFVIER